MDTNRAGAQLDPVQHQVVGFRAAARRIGRQLLQIVVVNRRKRMMRRVPALVFLVPLEHGKVHDPEEPEFLGIEQFVAIVILLRGEQAQLSARLVHGLLGPMSFRLARPGGQQQQVLFGRAGALAYAGHGTGIVPLQPLGIVEDAQAALAGPAQQLPVLEIVGGEIARRRDVAGVIRQCLVPEVEAQHAR